MRNAVWQGFDLALLFTHATLSDRVVRATREAALGALRFLDLGKDSAVFDPDRFAVDLQHAALHLDAVAGQADQTLDVVLMADGRNPQMSAASMSTPRLASLTLGQEA